MGEGLGLLALTIVLIVFGVAAVLLFWLFITAAVVWTIMAFEVFRDQAWRPFWKWVNQPCCGKPRLEWSVVSGVGISRCLSCDQTRVFSAYPF